MKTKGRETEKKKKGKEEKRSEEKKVMPGIELRTSDTPSKSFTSRLRRAHTRICRNFIIKTFEPY